MIALLGESNLTTQISMLTVVSSHSQRGRQCAQRIGVISSGLMGHGIAYLLVRALRKRVARLLQMASEARAKGQLCCRGGIYRVRVDHLSHPLARARR